MDFLDVHFETIRIENSNTSKSKQRTAAFIGLSNNEIAHHVSRNSFNMKLFEVIRKLKFAAKELFLLTYVFILCQIHNLI